jgi:histidyl-tRNA synthetase
MALSTQPYKGTRDFYPEDMRLRNWIFAKWQEVCERFGYEQYDGPILEPIELFTAKTSDEIVNDQTYSFTDRGGRQVVMRPEMTPTVSRMVAARRQELGYPLRLYSIVNCFRYERPQKGRLREFWQLNADLFGDGSLRADLEAIQLADNIMKAFGATNEMYEIRVNSRQLLNKRIEAAALKDGSSAKEAIRLIDKKVKLKPEDFKQQLAKYIDRVDDFVGYLEKDGATEDYEELKRQAEKIGLNDLKFVPTIARGFDYYTDIVFEVFDKNPDNNRSMFGGGRYDGLVGEMDVEPIPTVGFGMGDVTLLEFLKSNQLLPKLSPATDVLVLVVGEVYDQAQKSISELRAKGLNVAVDGTGRKLEKQIKAAEKLGISCVLFIGDRELKDGLFTLKNIDTGEEEKRSLEAIANLVREHRKQ